MSISVACGGCGKRFKAPDHGAGKQVPCPACKAIINIPAVDDDEDEDIEYQLQDLPPEPAVKVKLPASDPTASSRSPAAPPARRPLIAEPLGAQSPCGDASPIPTSPAKKAWVPPTRSSTPTWQRHLHWCLAFAMIPLAVSIFVPERKFEEPPIMASNDPAANEPAAPAAGPSSPSPSAGPKSTAPSNKASEESNLSPEEEAKVLEAISQMSKDQLLVLLPGKKLPGAFLARDSSLHWLFAFIAAAAYMTFLVMLASDKAANPLHLLGLGFFTATIGIFLLLAVQFLSQLGGGIRVRGGIIALVFLMLLLIGLSYTAANDPESGVITSFLGFTCGVGLCEEVCKALPVLVYYNSDNKQTWRGAFLWGMASGVGFGVSEGIMYSQDFYNGIASSGIYVVRFVSCVALHAIWSGSVAISINQRQYLLQEDRDEEDWWMYCLAVLQLIAIPMVLHGLYDTLLKKEMEFLALLTAVASFGYLAWQISHLRNSDDEDERAAYVANYIRSKAAAQGV